MSKIERLEIRVIELEKKLEELEKKGPGKKMEVVADWILSKFNSKKELSVRKLFDLGKQKGYRYQTLQLARRHLLDDKIGIEHKKGKGWYWVDVRK